MLIWEVKYAGGVARARASNGGLARDGYGDGCAIMIVEAPRPEMALLKVREYNAYQARVARESSPHLPEDCVEIDVRSVVQLYSVDL